MPTDVTTSATLKAKAKGGLIREDVMDKIWDISKIPLPFTDMVGSSSATQSYHEWTTDALAAPDITNARIDGADAGSASTPGGARVGNHCQQSDKVVKVSYRANASDTIGRKNELAYQIQRRQQELRRDVDAICLQNQASVADDGDTVAGKVGGLPSWLTTNHYNGTIGGFNSSTGLTVARTVAAKSALTETKVKSAVQAIYEQGGDATVFMSIPSIIGKFSEYMFTSSARIANLNSQVANAREALTAVGAVNVFYTDFGVLKFVPNRLQQKHKDATTVTAGSFVVGTQYQIVTAGTTDYTLIGAADSVAGTIFIATGVGTGTGTAIALCADVFILDPRYINLSMLQGYRTEMLAKTGTAEKRQITVDWTLEVNTERAHAIIGDIDFAATVTQ